MKVSANAKYEANLRDNRANIQNAGNGEFIKEFAKFSHNPTYEFRNKKI